MTEPRSAEDWARAGVVTTASRAMMARKFFTSILLCVVLEVLLGFDFIRGWRDVLNHAAEIGTYFRGTIKITFRKLNSFS
jgi:hypothetical protein